MAGHMSASSQQAHGSIIGPSRFWVKGNHVPEDNADTTALLPYYRYLPHRFASQRWTPQACKELQEQVLVCIKVSAVSEVIPARSVLAWVKVSAFLHPGQRCLLPGQCLCLSAPGSMPVWVWVSACLHPGQCLSASDSMPVCIWANPCVCWCQRL